MKKQVFYLSNDQISLVNAPLICWINYSDGTAVGTPELEDLINRYFFEN